MESSEWSDKLDMVVCWTSLSPAIKQLLGLQREGLDPPKPSPSTVRPAAAQPHRGTGGDGWAHSPRRRGAGPVLGGIAALPRNSCSDSLGGTQPPPQGQPEALISTSPVRPGIGPLLGKHGFPCGTAWGCRGCGPTGPPLPSHPQLYPQSSAGSSGGDRAGGHTRSFTGGISASLVVEGRGRRGQPQDPLVLPREPQEQKQPKKQLDWLLSPSGAGGGQCCVRGETLPTQTRGAPGKGVQCQGAAAGPGLGELLPPPLRPPRVSPLPPAQQSHGAATSAIAELTLQGKKKNNPKMSQAAPKSRSHRSPGAVSAPHPRCRGAGRCPAPGSPGAAPAPRPADMRHRAPPGTGLATTRSRPSSPGPRLGCGRAGAGQLKTTYSIYFLNTCSFMKTITLARSKHIQTNLLYDTRGCQRNGEKPLLIHSAVPAQPRTGNGRPGPLGAGTRRRLNSSCRS